MWPDSGSWFVAVAYAREAVAAICDELSAAQAAQAGLKPIHATHM